MLSGFSYAKCFRTTCLSWNNAKKYVIGDGEKSETPTATKNQNQGL